MATGMPIWVVASGPDIPSDSGMYWSLPPTFAQSAAVMVRKPSVP